MDVVYLQYVWTTANVSSGNKYLLIDWVVYNYNINFSPTTASLETRVYLMGATLYVRERLGTMPDLLVFLKFVKVTACYVLNIRCHPVLVNVCVFVEAHLLQIVSQYQTSSLFLMPFQYFKFHST